MLAQPRIEPLPPEQWSEAVRAKLDAVTVKGRVFNIFTTLWRHPRLAEAWEVFGGYTLNKSTLPARAREIVILRVAHRAGCAYEWSHHARIGLRAGLTAAEIAAIASADPAGALPGADRVLVEAVDELFAEHLISDATWARLAGAYETEQLMDLVFTAGSYLALALALNSFGVQLDEPVAA